MAVRRFSDCGDYGARVMRRIDLLRHRTALIGLVGGSLGFAALAVPIARGRPWAWDFRLARWLHGHEAALHLARFQDTFYRVGDDGLVPLFVAVVLLLIVSGRIGWAAFEIVAGIGLLGLNDVLKNAFARPSLRSALFQHTITFQPAFRFAAAPDGRAGPFPTGTGSYSFPSGHGLVTMALLCSFLVFARGSRAVRPIAVLGGFLVVVFGVLLVLFAAHYPTDVLAGWALAVAWISALSLATPGRVLDATLRRKPGTTGSPL